MRKKVVIVRLKVAITFLIFYSVAETGFHANLYESLLSLYKYIFFYPYNEVNGVQNIKIQNSVIVIT